MKKIAIPVSNDMLDRHFGHCKVFAIYGIEENKITSEEQLVPPPHEPGLLPRWLHEMSVTDVIAGGIGQRAIDLFNGNGINVFVGAPELSPRDIVEAHLNGDLQLRGNFCDH